MVKMNENSIGMYLHCGKCIEELKNNDNLNIRVSPKDYARIQCGWTKKGLQVWCNRHDCNIIHIDFEGQKHPADLTITLKKKDKAK